MNHLNDALSEVPSHAFGQPRLKATLLISDPWNDPLAQPALTSWIMQARIRRQLVGEVPTDYLLKDNFGNERVIDPSVDYTIADLYDAEGILLKPV